jgi:hypothetical protein
MAESRENMEGRESRDSRESSESGKSRVNRERTENREGIRKGLKGKEQMAKTGGTLRCAEEKTTKHSREHMV